MNYIFIDTCSWIDFACGRKDKPSFDFTENNIRVLDSLIKLSDSNEIVILKNEITDLEFKEADIQPLITAYKKSVVEQFRALLETKVIPHCKDHSVRTVFNEALINVDEIITPFQERSMKYNQKIKQLYNCAVPINVSEGLKQRALRHSIVKDHPMFINRQNNVNDFLILYSIQEWIESVNELKYLDETSQEHAIFFVTKNRKDFKIKNTVFDEQLKVSQLVKPIINLAALVSTINTRKSKVEGSADFLPNYLDSQNNLDHFETPVDVVIQKLNRLIELKKEFFISFLRRLMNETPQVSKLKYLGTFITPNTNNDIEEGFPIVRSQNVRDFKITSNVLLMGNSSDLVSKSKKGDILIISFGGRVGEHCLNDLHKEVYVHQSISVFRVNQEKVIPTFLDYFFRYSNLEDYSRSFTSPRLSNIDLINIHVNLPTLEQQDSMVKFVKEKEKEIEKDILDIKRKIKMLIM